MFFNEEYDWTITAIVIQYTFNNVVSYMGGNSDFTTYIESNYASIPMNSS